MTKLSETKEIVKNSNRESLTIDFKKPDLIKSKEFI